jgi:hypothetical protein
MQDALLSPVLSAKSCNGRWFGWLISTGDGQVKTFVYSSCREVPPVGVGSNWVQIATKLNDYLGDSWLAPPWERSKSAAVVMCRSLAEAAAGCDSLGT